MVARGAERRSSAWPTVGGWQLATPPQPRADAGAGRLLSLIALLGAVGIAIAAVFLARDAQPSAAPQRAAATAAAAQPATAGAATVPPPSASIRSAASAQQPASAAATGAAQGPTLRGSAVQGSAATVAAAQAGAGGTSLDQAAMEQVAAVEGRAEVLATSLGAEEQIRAYLGVSGVEMLPPAFVYVVEAGDTVAKIATRFGLQEATIRFNNFDIYDPDLLQVGSQLHLPVRDGVIYVVQQGDALDAVLQNYAADLDATLAFAGNGISNPDQIWVGQTLLLVDGSASIAGGSGGAGTVATTTWTMPSFGWPMSVTAISDAFGVPRANAYGYHTGVDWPAETGTLVGATAGGMVSYAGWDSGYGYWVEVDHGGGVRSRYAHLNEIFVEVNQWVKAGDFVGTVGNTGVSSGPHLHFEIIMGGQPRNPYDWLS